MTMCPYCGAFDGHFRDCPRLNDPEDLFFPERSQKHEKGAKKRKLFGVKESDKKKKK